MGKLHYTDGSDVEQIVVNESDFDANTILKADSDDTPEALTVAEQEVVGRLTGGEIDGVSLGIANDNVVQMDDADAADDDYAKFTANGLEGRSASEVVTDLTEPLQDLVGGMTTGNTETFISTDYQDADGTIDFVVPVKDEDDMVSDSDTDLATQQSIKAYVDNTAGTTTFTGLTDTPASYSGEGGNFVKVNAGETALEFVAGSVTAHDLGGANHNADTLANLNSKVSDATLLSQNDFNAKGDLLTATADNTLSVLSVGTNGHVLTADSGEASGVKWAAAPSGPTVVYKTSGESVNNSSTLQNDDELVLTVGANETWYFHMWLFINSGTTPDFKIGWSLPAGADMSWFSDGMVGALTTSAAITYLGSADTKVISGTGGWQILAVQGQYRGGANAGNLQLQWAQNVANASDTWVGSNSYLIAWQLA